MKAKQSPAEKTNRGRKSLSQENQARVAECRQMLEAHYHRGDIKRHLMERFSITRATADRIIAAAREDILRELSEAKDWWRAKSLATYAAVIRSEDASHRDRIRAQIAIDQLLGLREPTKVAMTDSAGRDLPPDEARDRLSALASVIAERIENAEKKRLSEAIPAKGVRN